MNVKFSKHGVSALGIFALALLIRVLYLSHLDMPNPFRGDAISYLNYAINLIEHQTFSKTLVASPAPDAYWAPGYPGFLALMMLLSVPLGADSHLVVLVAQAVLGAGVAGLTFLIGRIFLSYGWAIFSASLVVLSPHLITMGSYWLAETLFTFCLLLAIYFFVLPKSSWRTCLYSGIAFAVSYLVNPVVLFAGPILIFARFVLNSRGPNERLKTRCNAVYLLGPLILVVVLWALRSAVNVPDGALDSGDRIFANLVIGAHHDYHEIWRANPRDPTNPAYLDRMQYGEDRLGFVAALGARVLAQPREYLAWYLIEKPLQLWQWDILTGQGGVYVYPARSTLYQTSQPALISLVVMKSLHPWLLLSAMIGLFWIWLIYFKRRGVLLVDTATDEPIPIYLFLTIIYISAVYVVLQSEARYSVPLRPELYLCAAYGLSKIVKLLQYYKSIRP